MPVDAFFCLSFFLDVPSKGVPGRGGSWQSQQKASRTRFDSLTLVSGILQKSLRTFSTMDAISHIGSMKS